MREIAVRQLKAKCGTELETLPVLVTKDGAHVAVILGVTQYNELCRRAKAQPESQSNVIPSTKPEPPWYNPAVHQPGDLVRVQRGKRVQTVRVPALDGDGNPMPV